MKRGLCLAGMLVTLAGGGCATVQPIAPEPTNATLVPGTQGCHLVVRGDSAVWATVNVRETLFRIDPDSGSITDAIPLGPIPASDVLGRLAAGEGAVWVLHNRTVSRVDPVARRVVSRITVPGLVLGVGEILAAGGSVWVAAGPTLTRIDPRSNTVVASISAVPDPSVPPNRYAIGHMAITNGTLWAIAFQSLGSFWNPTAVRYALLTINTDSNAIRALRQLGAGDASRLFFGPTLAATDEAIWVSQPTGLYLVPSSGDR
jgi:streptogramin lyase